MKGDFTRIPRRRSRRFSGVRLQQGRVQLDADFNEQVEIDTRRDRLTARDLIGPAGAPEEGGGFAISPAVRLDAVALLGSEGAIAGELGSVLVSDDSGATWKAADTAAGTADLHGVAIRESGRLVVVGDGAAILTSEDGGATWTAAAVPDELDANLHAVAFADAEHGWAVGDGATILHTADGGRTWAVQQVPAGVDEDLHAVTAFDSETGWAVGGAGRILLSTGDSTWVTAAAPDELDANLLAVAFADAEHGWAVGEGAVILASEDGGVSWEQREPPAGTAAALRALALHDGGRVWAVGDGAAGIASHDGGVSWVALELGEAAGDADLRGIAAEGEDLLAVGERSTAIFAGEAAWQVAAVPASARDLAISAGRFYVDGTLVEADGGARLFDQPNLAAVEPPDEAGRYLVYLDVWQRHLTAVEEPGLREVALGGPDTTTRTRTVWQAKLARVAADAECRDFGPGWTPPGSESSGSMRAQAEPDELAKDECAVPASGGYRRLENQLYRVEVHGEDEEGEPTFVWSRDNGCPLTTLVDEIDEDAEGLPVLSVAETGRDAVGGFFGAQLVELSDERRVLAGEPGVLLEVERVEERRIVLKDVGSTDVDLTEWGPGAFVRRWDGFQQLVANGWRKLEDGVQVQFGAGRYATGDYWTIPARTATAQVEWPRLGGVPQFEPRHGTAHAQAPLALVDLGPDGGWTLHEDCRPFFTPLALQARLSMVGGDGQELAPADPDHRLPYPLEVSVMKGRRPVEGARVRFVVFEGGGSLAPVGVGATDAAVTVETGGDGLAAVLWTLAAGAEEHRVEAQLLDRLGEPLDAPVHFNARIAAGGGGEEPGIRVEGVSTAAGRRLQNDGGLEFEELIGGVDLTLDAPVDPGTVRRKPTCLVVLDLPLWGEGNFALPAGTIPVTLAAEVNVEERVLHWRPARQTVQWLLSTVREQLGNGELLVNVTLRGNFVYALDEPRLNVDGEAFGSINGALLDVTLPSGDGRRGGDLELWFRLQGKAEQEPRLNDVIVMPYTESPLLGDVARRWAPFARTFDLGLAREDLRAVLPSGFTIADESREFDPAAARKLFKAAELSDTYHAIADRGLVELSETMAEQLRNEGVVIELVTTASEDPVADVKRIQESGEQLDFLLVTEQTGRDLAGELPDLFPGENVLRL